jgi:hypothetical protein
VRRSRSAPVSRSEPNTDPLTEWQIAGDQRAASFVALAEDLEQQLCPSRRERHIAEFVHDQQLVAGELTLKAQ